MDRNFLVLCAVIAELAKCKIRCHILRTAPVEERGGETVMSQMNHVLIGRELTEIKFQTELVVIFCPLFDGGIVRNVPLCVCEGLNLSFGFCN